MTTPERMKALRKREAWTQGVLASKLGVTIAAVQQYEAGKYTPRPEIIGRLDILEKDPAFQPEEAVPDSGTRHIQMLLEILQSGNTRAIRVVTSTIEVFFEIVRGETPVRPERGKKAV